MATLARIVSFCSGFFLFGFKGAEIDLFMTAFVVDLVLAFLTASVATRRARSGAKWFALGLFCGLWAFAAALLLLPSPKASVGIVSNPKSSQPSSRLPSNF